MLSLKINSRNIPSRAVARGVLWIKPKLNLPSEGSTFFGHIYQLTRNVKILTLGLHKQTFWHTFFNTPVKGEYCDKFEFRTAQWDFLCYFTLHCFSHKQNYLITIRMKTYNDCNYWRKYLFIYTQITDKWMANGKLKAGLLLWKEIAGSLTRMLRRSLCSFVLQVCLFKTVLHDL